MRVTKVNQTQNITVTGNNARVQYNLLNVGSLVVSGSGANVLNNAIYGGATGITESGTYNTFRNNIASGQSTYCINSSGTNLTEDHNDWYGNVNGFSPAASDLNLDPKFVTNGTDFHLQSSSPCINAGTDVGLTGDYEGNAIVGLPDIGAYEYVVVPVSAATPSREAFNASRFWSDKERQAAALYPRIAVNKEKRKWLTRFLGIKR